MGFQHETFETDLRSDRASDRAHRYRALAWELGLAFREHGLSPAEGGDFSRAMLTGLVELDPACGPWRYALCPAVERFSALRRAGLGARADLVVMPPAAFRAMLRHHHRESIVDHAAQALERERPGASAMRGMTGVQRAWLLAFALIVSGLIAVQATTAIWALTLATMPVFYAMILMRLSAVIDAWSPLKAGVMPLRDQDLPVYTVLVPLFREVRVIPQLIRALERLDYPVDKLDIKILTEENDEATVAALRAADLPPHIEILVAPAGFPQTKPRALNIGLLEARGALLTIFDAEDRPDPRQLRLAANLFHRLPDQVGCLQGHLVIDNSDDGILTRGLR
jgi:phosphoglycolate phosphatase-like HAD superfamily hydrolase